MKHLTSVLVFVIVAVPVLGLGSCSYLVDRYDRAFEATTNGESLESVVNRFGSPSVYEIPGQPFLRYAVSESTNLRLWWEHPILRGIEGWSVEFDASQHVVHKAHWASP